MTLFVTPESKEMRTAIYGLSRQVLEAVKCDISVLVVLCI